MDFTIRLVLFVVLINWLASMHILHSQSSDSKIKFLSIVISVTLAVAMGFIII
jgi:hypothetical protein